MSPDETRVKIAEALGYTNIGMRQATGFWLDDPGYCLMGQRNGLDVPIPAFDSDLNDCHEMERLGLTTPELRKAYVNELDVITGANNQDSWSECLYCGFTATALQRCEAFLKTKKLWT
jgi:hypothetical protein